MSTSHIRRRGSLLFGARIVAIVGGTALQHILGERQTINTLAALVIVAVAASSVLATLHGSMDWRAAYIGSIDHHGRAREGCKKSLDLHVEGLSSD